MSSISARTLPPFGFPALCYIEILPVPVRQQLLVRRRIATHIGLDCLCSIMLQAQAQAHLPVRPSAYILPVMFFRYKGYTYFRIRWMAEPITGTKAFLNTTPPQAVACSVLVSAILEVRLASSVRLLHLSFHSPFRLSGSATATSPLASHPAAGLSMSGC